MTIDEARVEINKRIDRETAYVLEVGSVRTSPEGVVFLKEKLAENEKTIRLLGQFLADNGDEWEKFYRDNYWDKK